MFLGIKLPPFLESCLYLLLTPAVSIATSLPDDSHIVFDDMPLASSEALEADALANYTWGYFLSLDSSSELEHVVERYVTSLELDPGSEFLVKELLDAWAFTGRQYENKQILSRLSELARSRPDAVSLNLVVANAYIMDHQYAVAEQLLLDLFARTRWTEPFVIRELVICYIGSNKIKKAHRLLQQATSRKRFSGEFVVEHIAAVFYNSLGNTAEFRVPDKDKLKYQELAYEHAIKAADSAKAKRVMDSYGELMVLTAVLLHGNYTSNAISLLSHLPEWGLETEKSREILAECYESIGRPADALEIWRKLSETNPFNPNYHIRMGYLFKHFQRHRDALQEYKIAYQYRPTRELAYEIAVLYLNLDHPEEALPYALESPAERLSSWLLQSYVYQSLGQEERALAALANAKNLAVIPNESDAVRSNYYRSVATLSHSLNKIDDAVSSLEKALELEPNDPEMNNFLGYLLAEEDKDLARAETLIRTALKFDPGNVAYLDSLAWVFFKQGKFRKAAIYIEQAIARQKNEFDSIIFNHAGDIFHALGDDVKAQKYRTEALKYKNDSPDGPSKEVGEPAP